MFAYYLDLARRSLRRNVALTALMIVAIAFGVGASMTTLTMLHVLSVDPIPGKSQHLYFVQLDPVRALGYMPGEEPMEQMTRLDSEALLANSTMTPEMLALLQAAVEARISVLVSGGTGSGKTTLLNCLSGVIPSDERIVTIEDAAELQLKQPHVVSMETRPANLEGRGEYTIRDLVKNALRMRPDRIVVGECRGGEALDMLQAMNTGHDGSLTTTHANSPPEAITRLGTSRLRNFEQLF